VTIRAKRLSNEQIADAVTAAVALEKCRITQIDDALLDKVAGGTATSSTPIFQPPTTTMGMFPTTPTIPTTTPVLED